VSPPRPDGRPEPAAQRRRLIRALLAVPGLPALGWAAPATAPAAPLRVGLAPYLSPAALLAAFRPLREHLERALGEPVAFYTARDFHAQALALQRGELEFALVPAHLGRVAVADWGWTPMAGTIASTEVQVLVRDGGPVRSTQALRGRSVGMLDRLSLVAAVGTRWLADQGLRPGVDVTIAELPSINSALFALDRDEVGAVVAASTQLRALPA
jgi:phosphonate transport system substrate-binding protein